MVARSRCLSCHEVQGAGGRLSTVALDRIGSQLQPEYLRTFLREPSAVRVGLEVRMPRMNISEEDAAAFADFAARVLVDDRLDAWVAPPPAAVRDGAAAYDRLGCRGCHQIAGTGGYVGPDLTKVGRRLRPGWIAAWIAAPARWKADTVQPDYGLSEADVSALTAYLMTLRGEARPR